MRYSRLPIRSSMRWLASFSHLYSEDFYIALIPVLFWTYDKRFARYIATIFLVNHWFNYALKETVGIPLSVGRRGADHSHGDDWRGDRFHSERSCAGAANLLGRRGPACQPPLVHLVGGICGLYDRFLPHLQRRPLSHRRTGRLGARRRCALGLPPGSGLHDRGDS